MDSKINRIARKLVMAAGENVFDDYFTFYSDGAWAIQVVRKLQDSIRKMQMTPGAYIKNISKVDECVSYLSSTDVDEMSVSSNLKQIKSFLKKIKDNYSKYVKENSKEKLKQYNDSLIELKQFLDAYEETCVNAFRNRYTEDESNVNSLLQVIHEKGNEVLNKKQ